MSAIQWIEEHLLPCPSKYFFGIDCPGCGMQRSFLELIRGNFAESFFLYPALLPILVTFVLLGIHLKYKLNRGPQFILSSFVFSVSIIVVSFVIKQVHHYNQ
jgi:hypothetical protein